MGAVLYCGFRADRQRSITSGGAKRMIVSCVGLASRPAMRSRLQISVAETCAAQQHTHTVATCNGAAQRTVYNFERTECNMQQTRCAMQSIQRTHTRTHACTHSSVGLQLAAEPIPTACVATAVLSDNRNEPRSE